MQKQTEIYMKQNHMTRPGDGVLVGLSGERIPSVFAGTLEAAGDASDFPAGAPCPSRAARRGGGSGRGIFTDAV